ncbi:MAG: Cof-type HAD-IIB family hydrolase [Cyanobacteria bacterium P01_H01_bin.121]
MTDSTVIDTTHPEADVPAADIRLVVLDIDGTIAGSTNQIRPAVKQAVQALQQRSVHVAIATGRMYCSALRFYQELQLTLPLIAYQGAWIQDPATNLRSHHLPVPRALALEVLAFLSQPTFQGQLSIHLYIDDVLHVQEIGRDTLDYVARSGIPAKAIDDFQQVLQTAEATKILALSNNHRLLEQIWRDLQQRYPRTDLYLTRSAESFVEAAHPQVNKGLAVRHLGEEVLGLQPQQIMTIGDNYNDVEMLQYAGIGVAMGNAPQAVQAIADWVAPTVEADGVAFAIERYVPSARAR